MYLLPSHIIPLLDFISDLCIDRVNKISIDLSTLYTLMVRIVSPYEKVVTMYPALELKQQSDAGM